VVAIGELMNPAVVTVGPGTPVAEAAARMVQAKVGSTVVMQGTFLVGIVTERDVLRAAASGKDLGTSAVSEWMTRDPQWASSSTSADDAAQLMLLNGFRHLPVMDDGQLRGVVSLRELFAARISRRPI
jgi:CBS domain-containing protein